MFWTAFIMVAIPRGFMLREYRNGGNDSIHPFFRTEEETTGISVTEAARDHILSRGGTVYLMETRPVGLCCGRIAFEPKLTIGTPATPDKYDLNIIDDIRIYIPKRFSVPFPLTIDVKMLFGRKMLRLSGWRLL